MNMARWHCGDKETMADHVLAIKALSPGIVSSRLSLANVNDMVTRNHKGQGNLVHSGPVPDGGLSLLPAYLFITVSQAL